MSAGISKDTFAAAFKKTQAAALALKRQQAGEKLTAAQSDLISELGGKVEDLGEPTFAKNKAQLAVILELSRKTITRYSKLKDAPSPRANGDLNVAEWRKFLASHSVMDGDGGEDEDGVTPKERQILLQNKLLQQKIDVNDSVYVLAETVEKDTVDLIATAKTVLLAGPSSLAPQVVGVSVQEAETLLREWLHGALSKLQKNPLGKSGQAETEEA